MANLAEPIDWLMAGESGDKVIFEPYSVPSDSGERVSATYTRC